MPICRDLDRLTPCFRARVETMLERIAARDFDVQVWETYRSPERVLELVERGTGSARSVHPYGVAVDIVERDKTPWSENQPGLWLVIDEESIALGLHRVHRKRGGLDRPHVQALPAKYDRAVARVHGKLTPVQFDEWVANRMTRLA